VRYLYWLFLLPLSFIDSEKVHHIGILFLKKLGVKHRGKVPSKLLSTFEMPNDPKDSKKSPLAKKLMGLDFIHPIGLAGGFDKNGEALEGFAQMGFSFIEVGTVTPRAQVGNPLPRLFRDFHEKVIFNAMGFNNLGAEAVRKNILESRPFLPEYLKIGINVGKNKDTPIEEANRDYAICLRDLYDVGDYFVLNVSSPNTAGLRGLQNFQDLSKILDSVQNTIEQREVRKPFLIKVAPEIPDDLFRELIIEVEKNYPISGWILTNTLQRSSPYPESTQKTGGISGAPLMDASRHALQVARAVSKKVLISSGGILNPDEAALRMELGADLIQLYSGLIFEGPFIVGDIYERFLRYKS